MHTCLGKCCQESGETQPVRCVYPSIASVAREHVQRKEETQWVCSLIQQFYPGEA